MAANAIHRLGLTWLLVLLAVLATELSIIKPGYGYRSERWWELGIAFCLLMTLAAVVSRLPRLVKQPRPPLLMHLLTLGLFLLPLGTAAFGRVMGNQGILLEIVLAGCLRNLALALACLYLWPRLTQTAALLSLFLMVFALVQGEGRLLLWCLAIYSVLGCLWLLSLYWSRLGQATQQGPAPWGLICMLILVLASILVVTIVGPAKAAQTLWGFLASSGGREDYDPFSRGGVNTGDEVIKGTQDSRSTGMTDSDFFLDSPDDSLYDVTHDLYGDVIKPRDWQRAIALPAEKMLKKEIIPSESLEASKEFSLLRKPPPPTGDMEKTGASALLYIQGRVPVHLRLKAYDLFDGILWSEPQFSGMSGGISLDQEPWMKVTRLDHPEIYAEPEKHVIKVARFKTESLPFPANVARFRVGKVNQPNFFGWSQDDILRMIDRNVPQGTVTHVESRLVNRHALDYMRVNWERLTFFHNYLSFPAIDSLIEKLQTLSQSYVGSLPRGWGQVEAIVAGVRRDFQLDKKAQPPLDCRDVVSHFLTTRTGRDLDFATTTALLLRAQGYPCRVVSGFYGNPAHYDAKTEHTLVYKDDAHFWVEVLVGRKVWVPIEPTPGYETATPLYSWTDRVLQAATVAWRWCLNHPLMIGTTLVSLVLLIRFRREVIERWYMHCWRFQQSKSPREQLRYALELLEWRSRGTTWERPQGITPGNWYPRRSGELTLLTDMLAWAGYAPPAVECPWPTPEITAVCHTVVHRFHRRHLCRTTTSAETSPA